MVEDIVYAEEADLSPDEFLNLVQQVWPGSFSVAATEAALRHTINLTARLHGQLVGCVRLLSDRYFFSTVTEILVVPELRRRGIGSELMRLAFDASPCTLSFGAQPQNENFFTRLGYERTMSFLQKRKARSQNPEAAQQTLS